jgi:hypothetical protein
MTFLVRHDLRRETSRLQLSRAQGDRLFDLRHSRGELPEERHPGTAQLRVESVDEDEPSPAYDLADELGERVTERDSVSKPRRTFALRDVLEVSEEDPGDGVGADRVSE